MSGWIEYYGFSDGSEIAYSVQNTIDGGYVVVGVSKPNEQFYDRFWVLKLNVAGDIQWQASYGIGERIAKLP